MSNLYFWSVWLHILAAFVFFFAHGTALAIAFLLPKQRDANHMKLLLDITGITILPIGISLLVILLTSLHMGGSAGWWQTGWWGLSFLLFLVMVVWMTWYGRKFYSPIRKALGMEYMTGAGKHNPAEAPAGMDEVERLIAKTNPSMLMWIGLVITAVLLWLMRFKPF